MELLPASVAHPAIAILDARLTHDARRRRLPRPVTTPADADAWLLELVEDPADEWRSQWVQACAAHATTRRT